MTGVLVIPTIGVKSLQLFKSEMGNWRTEVYIPERVGRKQHYQHQNANTLLLAGADVHDVVKLIGDGHRHGRTAAAHTFGPSTERVKTFPNCATVTLEVVRTNSWRFAPVRRLSLCCVRTFAAIGPEPREEYDKDDGGSNDPTTTLSSSSLSTLHRRPRFLMQQELRVGLRLKTHGVTYDRILMPSCLSIGNGHFHMTY